MDLGSVPAAPGSNVALRADGAATAPAVPEVFDEMTHRRSPKPPKMTDVAELAGVSQTTVSFVINNVTSAGIAEETRLRVWAAVRQLGYRTNAAAKVLRTNRSHVIGFITDEVASTPFAGDIIKGAQDVAWLNKRLLMILNTNSKSEVEESAIEMMLEQRVGGFIYAAMCHQEVNPPPSLREIPAVLLNCYCRDRSLPSVVPDEVTGGRRATELLIGKGHRRIGFINILPYLPPARGRLEGYKHALSEHGIAYDPALVFHGNSFADSGYASTKELMLLPDRPTALFCGTDRVAMGAYEALSELGLAIPRDVAVIGFDNQELVAAYLRPSLSTMAMPYYEMGQWAVRYLIDMFEHDDPVSPIQQMLDTPLIERESA